MALSGNLRSKAYIIGRRYAKSDTASQHAAIARKEDEITRQLSFDEKRAFAKWIERGRRSNLDKSTETRYRKGKRRGRKRRTIPSHLRTIAKR